MLYRSNFLKSQWWWTLYTITRPWVYSVAQPVPVTTFFWKFVRITKICVAFYFITLHVHRPCSIRFHLSIELKLFICHSFSPIISRKMHKNRLNDLLHQRKFRCTFFLYVSYVGNLNQFMFGCINGAMMIA